MRQLFSASLLPVFPGCQNVFAEQLPQGKCRVDRVNISINNIIGQRQYINIGNIYCIVLISKRK